MANEIAKIARKEMGSKESIRAKASRHEDKAVATLARLLDGDKVPATAQAVAARELLDRIGGRPKLVDEKQSEQSQLEKMSAPELIEYISQQFSGLPMSVRAVLGESIAEGIAFDAADLVDIVKLDEPAEREPKPKREPRR
jgi:hypothetical protein